MTTTTKTSDANPAQEAVYAMWALRATALMQALDLALTVWAMSTTGFCEMNPLAAWIVRTTDSAAAVAVFKVLFAGGAVALLHYVRRERSGRRGVYAAAAVSVVLMGVWCAYLMEVGGVDMSAAMNYSAQDTTLVMLGR